MIEWLLAIETSTRFGGIALFKKEKLRCAMSFSPNVPASEFLVPGVRDLLKKESINQRDISALAVSVGPGSFTGLRVGLTMAKTFAYHLSIPIYTVSSLMVLAVSAEEQGGPIAAIMDARKGEVYGAYFSVTPTFKRVSEDTVMSIDDFLDRAESSELCVIGDAVIKYREAIKKRAFNITFASDELCCPSAEFVGKLVFQNQAEITEKDGIFRIAPKYLRQSEAEINWDRKHDVAGRG
jgi:tRNA threonylcarbamoyladenosine biosynthesis protein TsaB